jgi:holo-[acyl-carrier protein] synthase
MILGIGTDLVDIARMEAMHHRYGEALARRLLTQDELRDWAASTRPADFLAKRFAAKEALAKALGTGLRDPVLLGNIRVVNDGHGRPEFRFAPALEGWLSARGVKRVHLSLSDERTHALAFVIAEGP